MELVNLKTERRPGCVVALSFTVPPEESANAYRKTLKAYALSAQLPGFRKGKAPAHLVEQKFRDRVIADAGDELIRASIGAALAQDGLKNEDLIASPRILRASDFSPDQPFDLEIRLDVAPTLSPKDYKGVKLALKPAAVSDEQVEAELARIADSQATVITVDRAAATGDIVVIDFQGHKPDGSPIPHADGVQRPLLLGSNRFIPGFEDGLVGATAGESRTLSLTFPEDYPSEEMRGQKAEFKVTVTAVRERKVPAVDDDLARDVNYDGLDALKKDVRSHFAREKEAEARQELEADLLDRLRTANPTLDLPEALVAEEVERRNKTFERSLQQMRMTKEQYLAAAKSDESAHQAEMERVAREVVHSELILRAIGRVEQMAVSNEELSTAIARTAMHNDMSPQVLADRLGQEGRLPDLKFDLLKRKVLQFLLENADIDRGTAPVAAETGSAGDAESASSVG